LHPSASQSDQGALRQTDSLLLGGHGQNRNYYIRNRHYSQWVGCEELFDWKDTKNQDAQGWESCVAACAGVLEYWLQGDGSLI